MSNYDITVLALLFIIAFIKCNEYLTNSKITFATMIFALLMIVTSLSIFLVLFYITSL